MAAAEHVNKAQKRKEAAAASKKSAGPLRPKDAAPNRVSKPHKKSKKPGFETGELHGECYRTALRKQCSSALVLRQFALEQASQSQVEHLSSRNPSLQADWV
jgi:hypothetical protein